MELKVIPVVQVIIAVLLMIVFSKLWPELRLNWPAHKQIAIILFSLAIVVGISAIVSFKRHKTTVNPTKPVNSANPPQQPLPLHQFELGQGKERVHTNS